MHQRSKKHRSPVARDRQHPATTAQPSLLWADHAAAFGNSSPPQAGSAASVPDRRLVDIPAARAALGVGRSTLFELLRRGDLQAVKVGRRTFIVWASIERFVAALPAAVYQPARRSNSRALPSHKPAGPGLPTRR